MPSQMQTVHEAETTGGDALPDGVIWSRSVPAVPATGDDADSVSIDVYREGDTGNVSIFVGDYVQFTAENADRAADALASAALFVRGLGCA